MNHPARSQFFVTLLTGLLTLAVGILFAAKPDILSTICLWAGIVLCAGAAVCVILYFLNRRTVPTYLIYGIIAFVAGGILLIVPHLLKFLIPIFFGGWILISSVSGLYRNFMLRRDHRLWWVGLLLCAVGAALGVYVMTRPFEVMETTVRLIGIVLCVFAVLRIVSCIMARHYFDAPTMGDVIDITPNKD